MNVTYFESYVNPQVKTGQKPTDLGISIVTTDPSKAEASSLEDF